MAASREDFQVWVQNATGLDEDSFVAAYAAELELGSYTVADLFKDMRPYMEEENLLTIARAMAFLPRVFKKLFEQQSPIARGDKDLIIAWLCQRISNEDGDLTMHAGLDDALSTIEIIATSGTFGNFGIENGVDVAIAIFKLAANTKMIYKDLKVSTRAKLIDLVSMFFEKNHLRFMSRPGLKETITSFTDLALSEKSPSGLGHIFSLYKMVSTTWAGILRNPVNKELAQALFASFFRYFPVNMKGKNNLASPGVPTLEELSEAVEELVSQQIYAEFAVKELLDRLDSALDAKLKTLSMLLKCFKIYDAPTTTELRSSIWTTLNPEIWKGSEEEVVQATLDVLHQVCKNLATAGGSWSDPANTLNAFITEIAKDCHDKAQNSLQWYIPISRVFLAMSTSSVQALWQITKTWVPQAHLKWQGLASGNDTTFIMVFLNSILASHTKIYELCPGAIEDPNMSLVNEVLQDNRNDIEEILGDVLGPKLEWNAHNFSVVVEDFYLKPSSEHNLLEETGINGLMLAIIIPGFLLDTKKRTFVQTIAATYLSTTLQSTRQKCIAALQEVATGDPMAFNMIILPVFFRDLPQHLDAATNISQVLSVLNNLVSISCTKVCQTEYASIPVSDLSSTYWHRNFDALVRGLIGKVEVLLSLGGQWDYINIILSTISLAVTKLEESLATARESPLQLKPPPPERPETAPFAYIIESLFKLLKPTQQRHQTWEHTSEIQWYTGVGPFPAAGEQQADTFVQSIGQITLKVLRSSSTTPENNPLLNWSKEVDKSGSPANECSALSSLFTKPTNGCPFEMLDLWQSDIRRGPNEKCLANVLAMYMVAGTRPEDRSKLGIDMYEAATNMMKGFIGFDIEAKGTPATSFESSPLGRTSMLWYMQLLVNKFGVAKEGPGERSTPVQLLDQYVVQARSPPAFSSLTSKHRESILILLAHFLATSVACFDVKTMETLFILLIGYLTEPAPFGPMAARLFRMILSPSPIITRENFCRVRSISHGWTLRNIVDKLTSSWRDADPALKSNYLVALAGLLRFIDAKDYVSNLGAGLLPAILQGTQLQDSSAKLFFLDAISAYLEHDTAAVKEYLKTVVSALVSPLRTTQAVSDRTIELQVKSLTVLRTLIKAFERSSLSGVERQITEGLEAASRGSSPEVRREASKVLVLWLNSKELGTE